MKRSIKEMTIALVLVGSNLLVHGQQLTVSILQGQKKVAAEENRYQLQKSPFTFLITANQLEGFLIGATFDEDVYLSAIQKADLEVTWFENTGMADALFNPEQIMCISNDAPSYWYYSNPGDHRFDKDAKGTASQWIAKRSVAKLDVLESKEQVALQNINRPLYVVFYNPIYDNDYNLVDKTILFHAQIMWKGH
ncbi:hypothetical protein [Sphingobacterium sp. SYP-B4668]|uniref:hypothetical protein n=1 Tax=Sphingobacterium sp. SYP-B4668 TaxID=2996035 RepID=UPI0022DE1E5C|nr:hypothetical protein [Sphingobacterium sp. SYP-B4668]